MKIGENIRARREQLGLTQVQLVEKAKEYIKELEKQGITEQKAFDQAMLSKWENGDVEPSIDKLCILTTLLNTTLDSLLDKDKKEDIKQVFYNEGYRIAKEHSNNNKSVLLKLLNAMNTQDVMKVIHEIMTIYCMCNEYITEEMGRIMLEATITKDFETFSEYIQMFQMGFNNGTNSK